MPPPFRQITLPQFAALVESFTFTRRIVEVHMHHTWRPNRSQYQGAKTINGMWRHHTAVNGWSDIAQHITIAPDGTIWLGRNWNRSPASSGGFNGTSARGPFMFEIIGDFDAGHDPFDGPQRDTVIGVIAHVQRRFGLQPEALRFHNEMSSKSCPGNAISKADVIAAVRAFSEALDAPREGARGARAGARRGPFAASELEGTSLREISTIARELEAGPGEDDPFDAEPTHDEVLDFDGPGGSRGARAATARGGLTPGELRLLRPHVINLRQGRFSDDGDFDTTKEDVDAIFERHLSDALAEAQRQNRKLRILFHAHGGLTSESSALRYAFDVRGWWLANGVYPLFFVWETGLTETLKDMFAGAQRGLERATGRGVGDWLADHVSDPALEKLARIAQGERIWSSMKWSAEKASEPEGGARYVAERLRAFCGQHADRLELHAVGHSAGSIFHAHFLPCAIADGGVRFDSLHLLAPAIRVDEFNRRLKPLIGRGVDTATIFTMDRDTERADCCGTVYRKSLLYLIHYSLEREREAAILGLQISLERDRELRALFGLDGVPSPHGEIIWSPTDVTTGRSASAATEHGGFDNDRRTMESVLRRVIGADDHAPITPYPDHAERSILGNSWDEAYVVPDEVLDAMWNPPKEPAAAATNASTIGFEIETKVEVPEKPIATTINPSKGARRALCVGIDEYRGQPLSGCVADARLWKSTLKKLGFDEIRSLENAQATREAIMKELGRLIDESEPGDVLAFQYAGHGTQVPDVSGDEKSDDPRTAKQDEALCPFDLDLGHLLIDDDVATILARAKPGVNVTLFIDCCHSGTISRFGVAGANGATGDDSRARFIVASDALVAKHLEFRATLERTGSRAAKRPHAAVLFSACKSWEVAWEKNGQGDFTRLATGILSKGIAGLTVEKFQAAVTSAFGSTPRQHPDLDCPPAAKSLLLLGGIRTAEPVAV